MSRTAAILLAAGSGSRMAGSVADKVLAPLAGRPVFAHSAAAFAASGVADLYVVVYRDQRQMLTLSAHAPTPRGVNSISLLPSRLLCISSTITKVGTPAEIGCAR